MTGLKYYNDLNKALIIIESNINSLEVVEKDEYNFVNYSLILNKLYTTKRMIERYLNIHKYYRLTKEEMIKRIDNQSNSKVKISYEVKEYENAQTIAEKFNMELESLLRLNNILSSEIESGKKILVETTDFNLITQNFDIPTYGDQTDTNILGTDISVNPQFENNDFQVLGNIETLEQGIRNRIRTFKKEYPAEPNFGIQNYINMPDDLNNSLRLVDIIDQVKKDGRVQEVLDAQVQRQGNSVVFNLTILTTTNQTIEI